MRRVISIALLVFSLSTAIAATAPSLSAADAVPVTAAATYDPVSQQAQEPGRGDDLARIKRWRSFLDRASRAFFAARLPVSEVEVKIEEADRRIAELEASDAGETTGRSDITGDVPFLEKAHRAFTAAHMNTADAQKWLAEARAKDNGPTRRAPNEDEEIVFHTFSIVAVDPATGESGVAVTTRVPCVGNGVPWVRAGVGAVATQASTRTAYGAELLDLMAQGLSPEEALEQRIAADDGAARRQVGVVALDGRSAQHTGSGTSAWAGHRSGPNYAVQGNLLVGEQVIDAVADSFEASAGTPRHLADRLIDALAAGQATGGDARHGRLQSAAVIVADPRDGRSRRADGMTAHINVCEHPTPVAELRRIYNSVSRTLGYRTMQQFSGPDVWQLKIILHALGHYRAEQAELERDDDADLFTAETVASVDAFRVAAGLRDGGSGSPPGLVDAEAVAAMWAALEARGIADDVRRQLLEITAVRR